MSQGDKKLFTYILIILMIGCLINMPSSTTLKVRFWYTYVLLSKYEACLNKQDAMRRENYLKSSDGHFYIKRRLREYLTK